MPGTTDLARAVNRRVPVRFALDQRAFRNYSYLTEETEKPEPMSEHSRDWLQARFDGPNPTVGDMLGVELGWRTAGSGHVDLEI